MAFLNKAQAEEKAERLAHHIRKYGVPVVIDLRTGAGGNHWGVDTHIGAMAHHIVSRRSQGLTPFYSLVRNGRSDVPGPLSNIYGGWDQVARIVTMGLANHPGRGGPWIISGRRIPRDNGRYYFMGTEFEGGLNAADWDADYRRFMGAVNAGKLDYLREQSGIDLRDTALCEHSDWARPKGRKIDRLGYTQASGVAEMVAARGGATPVPAPAKPKPTTPVSRPVTAAKTIGQLAQEVIDGKHGNGDTRRRYLGTRYAAVQAEVNRRLTGRPMAPATPSAGKSIATMAQEVIDGRHGTGHANRRRSLGVSAAVYEQVRAEVNRRAGIRTASTPARPAGKSISQMAAEVLRGDHGNGHDVRRRSLGVNAATYAEVRAAVNRRVG